MKRWTELIDDLLIEFEGDPKSAPTRRVIAMRSLRPLAKRQKAAGIPPSYRHALMESWQEEKSNPGVFEIVHAYLLSPNNSLYIWGRIGVGKTWTACAVANALLQQGHSVHFQTVTDLLLQIRSTFSSENTSELDVLSPLFETHYLVLDEVGDIAAEHERQASEFAASRLLALLNRRWQDGKPTIMTSNLPLNELKKWSGDDRIVSRIFGMCGEENVVEIAGRDLRVDPVAEEVRAE